MDTLIMEGKNDGILQNFNNYATQCNKPDNHMLKIRTVKNFIYLFLFISCTKKVYKIELSRKYFWSL